MAESKVVLPVIPPKKLQKEIKKFEEPDSWFFVKSPREEFGPMGPCEIPQLRDFKKGGDIVDTTLMWRPGMKTWQMLGNLPDLKGTLNTLPPIPQRNENQDEVLENVLYEPPTDKIVEQCESLSLTNKYTPHKFCSRCGHLAVSHAPGIGQQLPVISTKIITNETTGNASEIIDGFLWIGNSSTGGKTK
jgi:hypothetical protein